MAIWQYDMVLAPRQTLLTVLKELPQHVEVDVFDRHNWWAEVEQPSEKEIGALLPRTASWSDSIKAWGSEDGNRMECHFNNGELFEVRTRIDLRDLSSDFIGRILELARRHDWLLWTEEGELFEPQLETVMEKIRHSSAFSFVRDPHEFLDRLSENETS